MADFGFAVLIPLIVVEVLTSRGSLHRFMILVVQAGLCDWLRHRANRRLLEFFSNGDSLTIEIMAAIINQDRRQQFVSMSCT